MNFFLFQEIGTNNINTTGLMIIGDFLPLLQFWCHLYWQLSTWNPNTKLLDGSPSCLCPKPSTDCGWAPLWGPFSSTSCPRPMASPWSRASHTWPQRATVTLCVSSYLSVLSPLALQVPGSVSLSVMRSAGTLRWMMMALWN